MIEALLYLLHAPFVLFLIALAVGCISAVAVYDRNHR